MVGISQIVGCGVIVKNKTQSGGTVDIVTDRFVFDGIDNVFVLSNPAIQVLDIYIDNGVYPDLVPMGATPSVIIDPDLILKGNVVTVKYKTPGGFSDVQISFVDGDLILDGFSGKININDGELIVN